MLDPVIDLLNDQTPLFPPFGKVVVIIGLFLVAWAISRVFGWVFRRILRWHDRRQLENTSDLVLARRRETLVRVARASVTAGVFVTATVLSIGQLVGGIDRLSAIVGASFALVVAGFGINRLLPDVVAGFFVVTERWYSVGDTVSIPLLEVEGIVEDVSLRRTKLRALNGDVIHVPSSSIGAARVLPRGARQQDVELYVADEEAGLDLVAEVVAMLPIGHTTFVERPAVLEVEELSDELTRIRVRATVAAGRDWLVERFLCDLLRERAADGLIVHGPVTFWVDEKVEKLYARAALTARAR